MKRPLFQAFVGQAAGAAVPEQDVHAIGPPIDKDKRVPAERTKICAKVVGQSRYMVSQRRWPWRGQDDRF